MAGKHGLWISFEHDPDRVKLESAIHERGEISTTVSDSQVRPRKAELAIVSLDGGPDFLALVKAGARAVTGKRRISISRFTSLGAISYSELSLSRKVFDAISDRSTNVHRVTPAAWEKILQTIGSLRPDIKQILEELDSVIEEAQASNVRLTGDIDVLERDAVASALQTFGGTKIRKRVIGSAKVAQGVQQSTSFLSRLTNVSVREDPQIANDAVTFPGLQFARQFQVGAFELRNDQGERLTILNCNRQPLEATLGVDLIYYNHRFDSFVLVQYKRMTKEGRRAIYRPTHDKNHDSELARMSEIEDLLRNIKEDSPDELSAFRLSSRPFYFKLCEPTIKNALDEGMVSGMYVPVTLWKSIVVSPKAQGIFGAPAIGWDNCGRYLNNGEFTNLLRSGWIGSSAGQTRFLEQLIKAVIEGDRMLVLAITRPASGKLDFIRDSYGRFASEDDPLASR